MPRLQSSISGPATQTVSDPQALGGDIDAMSDEELDARIKAIAGARTMSGGASKRPGSPKAHKAPETGVDELDI